jgi:hypothetical protein
MSATTSIWVSVLILGATAFGLVGFGYWHRARQKRAEARS